MQLRDYFEDEGLLSRFKRRPTGKCFWTVWIAASLDGGALLLAVSRWQSSTFHQNPRLLPHNPANIHAPATNPIHPPQRFGLMARKAISFTALFDGP